MRNIVRTLLIASFVLGCGFDDRRGPRGNRDLGDPDIDPIEDIGDGPNESDEGEIWRCVLTGEGDNGADWVTFEDEYDICFEDQDDATDFVNEWVADCVDAFVEDGFVNYDCNADCDNSFDEC